MDDSEKGIRALEPGELDIFVRCAEISKIEELGSKAWMDCHLRYHKLQQQAVLEAANFQEEATRDAIISYGKIPTLISEAICVSIWRQKILPKILQLEKDLSNTFLLYSVLYHETVAVGLLEVVCSDEEACGAIPDVLVDIIDYAIERITDVIGLVNDGYLEANPRIGIAKDTNTVNDFLLQQKDFLFDIGMRCITIVSCLANVLDKIHVSASSRLYGNHDAPLLLVELLNKQPWKKFNDEGNVLQFIDGRWKLISESEMDKICGCETLTWIALVRLILNPDVNKYYEINNFRKTQLCKLMYQITDPHMDQIPMLIELKRSLGQLSVTDVSFGHKTKKPLLIEVVPEIKTSIMNKIHKKAKSIAKAQLENHFKPDKNETMELAKMLSSSYTSDVLAYLDDGGAKCASCGDRAAKKCSRCKTEWYCGRECQVKRWPNHKDICDQFASITE